MAKRVFIFLFLIHFFLSATIVGVLFAVPRPEIVWPLVGANLAVLILAVVSAFWALSEQPRLQRPLARSPRRISSAKPQKQKAAASGSKLR